MSRKDNRLSIAQSPLSYEGVRPESSILIFSQDRAPTVNDTKFLLGTEWINTINDETWILVDLSRGIATWRVLSSPTAFPAIFTCDTGTAIPTSGVLDFVGDATITTIGTANTVTINVAQGFDGQILIGSDTGSMALANIVEGPGVTINNGANSISIVDNGGGGVINLDADSGTANPIGSNIQIAGGTNINTAAAGDAVTINLDNNVSIGGVFTISSFGVGVLQTDPAGVVFSDSDFNGTLLIGDTAGSPAWGEITSPTGSILVTYPSPNTINLQNAGAIGITTFDTDSGTATQAANNINVYGGTNISSTAAADHLDLALNSNVTLSGTLTLPWTNGVLWTDASGVVNSSNGANGETLIGGDTTPVWDEITSSTLTITKGANSIEIEDPLTYPRNSLFNVTVEPSDLNCFQATMINNTWKTVGPGGNLIPPNSYLTGDVLFDEGNNWTFWKEIGDPDDCSRPFYTAPVAGKYFLQYQQRIDVGWGVTLPSKLVDITYSLQIITTNKTYTTYHQISTELSPGTIDDSDTLLIEVITDLDAGDTVQLRAKFDGACTNIPALIPTGEAEKYPNSWFSGYIIV